MAITLLEEQWVAKFLVSCPQYAQRHHDKFSPLNNPASHSVTPCGPHGGKPRTMRVLQLCLAIALASVAAGFPIQDHKLFVQQALVSLMEPVLSFSSRWLESGFVGTHPLHRHACRFPLARHSISGRIVWKRFTPTSGCEPSAGPQSLAAQPLFVCFYSCLFSCRSMSADLLPGWTTCALCKNTTLGTPPTGYVALHRNRVSCRFAAGAFSPFSLSMYAAWHECLCRSDSR